MAQPGSTEQRNKIPAFAGMTVVDDGKTTKKPAVL